MNFPFFVARRYLFSKKSHNAINIISLIAAAGIAISTMAMVCVLSVFNGFGSIVNSMFSAFDPQLKISATQGKVFDYRTLNFERALAIDAIEDVAESLEDNALLRYEDRQVPVLLKGVSEHFNRMANFDQLVIDGKFRLHEDSVDYATIGAGLALNLGVRAAFIAPIQILAPKRDVRVNLANPAASLSHASVQIGGVFSLNQPEYDEQMALVPIDLARSLFRYTHEVSSLGIKLKQGASVKDTKNKIQSILGPNFLVENRYEQQAESYNMLQIEKWVTFLILSFILLIAIFNIIAPLFMLIIEKKEDIQNLKTMGASRNVIARIFLFEGWLIAFSGIIIGLALGIALCLLQQHFGLLRLSNTPGAFVVDAYPVVLQFWDIAVIFFIVSLLSFLAVLYPVHVLKRQLKEI